MIFLIMIAVFGEPTQIVGLPASAVRVLEISHQQAASFAQFGSLVWYEDKKMEQEVRWGMAQRPSRVK